MKIGINASFARKGDSGMGQVTINFLRKLIELKMKGEKLKVVLYLEEDLDLELPEGFEKRIFLPPYRRDDLIRKVWWEKFSLPKKIKEDGCDVFLSLYQSTSILSLKHVMLVHDVVPEIFPQYLNNWRKRIYYSLVKKAVQEADHVLTISKHSQKDIVKFYNVPVEKITVNPIDCSSLFKEKLSLEISPEHDRLLKERDVLNRYIFYVGGFDVRKNVAGLLEAYGILHQKMKKQAQETPTLVLAGKFNRHLVPLVTDVPGKIKELKEKYQVPQEKVLLIGFVEDKILPYFYWKASLFCYPSFYEGFGLPPLEAMNVGCPVITSTTSSLPEVTGEEGALLVAPENPQAIAEAMEKVLTDESLKERLVAEGKKRATLFSWEKFTKQTLETIQS